MGRWKGTLALVASLGLVACGSSSPTEPSPEALVGSWRATWLQLPGQPVTNVPSGVTLSASFGGDGRLALVADCNRCNASWQAGGSALTVGPMACTLAACPSSPLDTRFSGLVGAADTWEQINGQLELRSSAGIVRLER